MSPRLTVADRRLVAVAFIVAVFELGFASLFGLVLREPHLRVAGFTETVLALIALAVGILVISGSRAAITGCRVLAILVGLAGIVACFFLAPAFVNGLVTLAVIAPSAAGTYLVATAARPA